MRVAYLHGFASSPSSRKGVHLSQVFERLGVAFERPDLNRPSFAKLDYDAALTAIGEMVAAHRDDRWCLIGSSMGGYLAARWMELNPDRIWRALLLCPAFDMPGRWPTIVGEPAWSHWQKRRTITLPDAYGRPSEVHWGLVESARRHPPFPRVPVPTRIIHGNQDAIVPLELSQQYAREVPDVTLIEVDDEHPLTGSIALIEREALEWFEVERESRG